MNRIALALLMSALVFSPALAIELFNKVWLEHYVTNESDESFAKRARAAGCYLCHVKGADKREVPNEYGRALDRYLDADDFPKEWVDANPKEAKRKIIEAFRKVEEDLASDDQTFGQKIDA